MKINKSQIGKKYKVLSDELIVEADSMGINMLSISPQ